MTFTTDELDTIREIILDWEWSYGDNAFREKVIALAEKVGGMEEFVARLRRAHG